MTVWSLFPTAHFADWKILLLSLIIIMSVCICFGVEKMHLHKLELKCLFFSLWRKCKIATQKKMFQYYFALHRSVCMIFQFDLSAFCHLSTFYVYPILSFLFCRNIRKYSFHKRRAVLNEWGQKIVNSTIQVVSRCENLSQSLSKLSLISFVKFESKILLFIIILRWSVVLKFEISYLMSLTEPYC